MEAHNLLSRHETYSCKVWIEKGTCYSSYLRFLEGVWLQTCHGLGMTLSETVSLAPDPYFLNRTVSGLKIAIRCLAEREGSPTMEAPFMNVRRES